MTVLCACLADPFLFSALMVASAQAQGCPPVEEAKLLASDGSSFDYLGVSMVLSRDTALVGAVSPRGLAGAAYVFVNQGGSWVEEVKLTASDMAIDDVFGEAVSLQRNNALIGAPCDSHTVFVAGSAHVFVRIGSVRSEEAKLTAADAYIGDQFGDLAVVGAPRDNYNGQNSG